MQDLNAVQITKVRRLFWSLWFFSSVGFYFVLVSTGEYVYSERFMSTLFAGLVAVFDGFVLSSMVCIGLAGKYRRSNRWR